MSRRKAPTAQPVVADSPVTRAELCAVVGVVLLAASLRFAFPGRMAVEHFDEGVYASNLFFPPGEGYPYRHLYAPPLLPWLIEWGMIFLGPESIAPFLPALVLGMATAPLAWWAVRRWFGPAAGLAAGLLVATNDFHLLYSRTALTDAPVAFFLLLAVYLFWEAVRRNALRWSVAAGVATGLAWWTKYTGWLPLAIAASGGLAWIITERRAAGVSPRVRTLRLALHLAAMSLIACLVWSPVLWDLQSHGGYAAVAANHRGYLSPLAEWPRNLWEQGGNLAAESGILTDAAFAAFAAAVPLAFRSRQALDLLRAWKLALRIPLALWAAVVVGWTAFTIGPAVPLALFAAGGLAVELAASRRSSEPLADETENPSFRRLAAWLLAAWFVGMLVTTPLYHPYPRLTMPWLIAAMLGSTVWLSGRPDVLIGRTFDRTVAFAAPLFLLPACVFCPLIFPGPWYTARGRVPGWEDRTGLRHAVSQIATAIGRNGSAAQPTVVSVLAPPSSPAVFFHLAAAIDSPRTAVMPAGDLSFPGHSRPDARSYLVTVRLFFLQDAAAGPMLRHAVELDVPDAAWLTSGITVLDEGGAWNRQCIATDQRGSMWPQLVLYRRVP